MNEESFEELFNESLNQEEKKFDKTVTGKVISISSKGEIFVDFGYKADGIVPADEYSDEEGKNPRDEFQEGDTITADVLKWNDGLGNVLLSYKKYRRRENYKLEKERREQAAKERQAKKEQFAKDKKEFWENLKAGNTYVGTIAKIADYGLFVDLQFARGLLHISEITWDRDEKLADKFEVNEQIEVVVKSFDKDAEKIELAYPLKGENPWYALADKYSVNDVVTCKVVKFAPFGAFVEIEPGLEGLVHNSEITSLKHVINPEEELQLGQMVNAKIINIDKEKRKIGLTIKELEGTSKEYGYEEYIKGEENEQ